MKKQEKNQQRENTNKTESKKSCDKINKKISKKIVIISLIAIILVFILACFAIITIPKIIEKIKSEENKLLSYEIVNKKSDTEYQILITIKSDNGLEYIKLPDGDTIKIIDGRTTVGIDYKIIEEVKYDFIIKQIGKEEVTESIFKDVQKIEGNYALVNGVYVNKPDLSGFNSKYTRYLNVSDEGKMIPGEWITAEANDLEWYSYKDAKWANIYYELNGANTYYVWIPRYCFKLDQENERSDVKFIDTSNNYIDAEGNKITWEQLKEEGYQIPEAFQFGEYRIPGYWAMKYTAGDITTPSTVNFDMSVYKGVVTVRNIKLNTSITNTNQIVKYTFALNGKIIKTLDSTSNPDEIANIEKQVIEFADMIKGDNTVNVTGLNAKGEIVGSMTKLYSPAVVNEPDLSGFDKNTTFYVTYDSNGQEHSTIPITEGVPNDWYEYGESRWANIVTRNNELETYYVWIPRYQFQLDQTNQRSIVKFISGTSKETDEGYQIPEAFWFDKNGNGAEDEGEQLTGYWAMKYTAGDAAAQRFSTELVATSSSIITKGITGTAVGEGQKYKYYINGEYKGEKTSKDDTFEFSGLSSNTKYTVLVEVRNNATDEYVGTIVKQISTIDANKPELTGFNSNMTYYVLYDESGNQTIGDKIKNDGSNIPQKWYSYSESKWANIVVTDGTVKNGKIENATMTTYYTWIPRYEFTITSSQYAQPAAGRTEVRFISGTSKETDIGYQIPEAFWFDKNGNGTEDEGEQLTGYWAMKYTAGE